MLPHRRLPLLAALLLGCMSAGVVIARVFGESSTRVGAAE